MEHALYKADRLGVRTALALVGAAVIAVGGAAPSAGAQVTLQWQAREFQTGVFGVDDAVDIAYWKDDSVFPAREWVYMTGYQTMASGATVFATHKYDANDPGPVAVWDKRRFYPDPPAGATGTNRAVAIEVDPANGDVYVTGESSDPNPNSPNGLDYVTIKYDKFLVVDPTWRDNSPNNDGAMRWDNVGGADRPVDIALGKLSGAPDNVIAVTGTSYGGPWPGPGDDIATRLLNARTGIAYGVWSTATFNGTANGDDRAVEVDVYWINIGAEGTIVPYVYVAGTTQSSNSGQVNDDIVTIQYDHLGNRGQTPGVGGWTKVYNGPGNGEDVATGMAFDGGGSTPSAVFVCGYTPHYVAGQSASASSAPLTLADTDYIALGYDFVLGDKWGGWPDPFTGPPNGTGVRVFNGLGPTSGTSDDRAMDIVVDDFIDKVWLTGYVREADGTGYDAASIAYDFIQTPPPPFHHPNPDVELILNLPTTTETALALDAHGRDVYVTARIQPGTNDTPLILTFKIKENSGMYAFDWMRLFGNGVSDIPSAIIAPTAINDRVAVFVAGRSFLISTSHDQISLRYTEPP